MQAEHGKFERSRNGSIEAVGAYARRTCCQLCLLIVCLLQTIGSISCARLQLPAIDPNGSCIFLPYPNSTQLVLPRLHSQAGPNGHSGIVPTPAFTSPAMPPPCVDGNNKPSTKHSLLKQHKLAAKVKDHFASPGKTGEIQLTPTRVVAPVGGEVVLLAGLCGRDGHLVKREPLEWMLSPDSVGTFIDVGDDASGHLISSLTMLNAPKVEKLDVDFAKGRTSSKETLITRGSPDCKDDIELKTGQTWLSISSPSEGISRVTVLAPDSEIWDRRRQTATIYWVDAQWQFPAPQIKRSGNTLTFATRVTKAEEIVPAAGWMVRYTIVDPSVASFVPVNDSSIASIRGNVADVRVDADGRAIIQVVAAIDAAGQPARGTTPILIDVIRPVQSSDSLPELTLGSGQTFATFSSPGLQVQAFGNDAGMVGEQLTYVASVGNPGDVPTENTKVMVQIPSGMKFVSAVPLDSSVAVTNTGVMWDQGVLDAHRQLDVSIVLEALQPGTFDVVFQAAGSGNLTAESRVRTEITEPSVALRFEPLQGAAQAELGQTIEYGIDVTNTSRQTLTNLRVVIESDIGLPEFEGVGTPTEAGQPNKFEQSINYLNPNETQRLSVTFVVRQEGQLGSKVRIMAGENKVLVEQRASILGIAPRPKQANVGISIEFSKTLHINEPAEAIITISNPGEVLLTGVKVELAWDPSLLAYEVDEENLRRIAVNMQNRTAVWTAQDLLPPPSNGSGAQIRILRLGFRVVTATPQASLNARVTTAENVQASDSVEFQVITNPISPPVPPPPNIGTPNGLPPAVPPPGSGAPQRTGNWEIDLSDWGDPTTAGNEIRYTVTIRNRQNLNDQNVRIVISYPQGVQFTRVTNLTDGSPVDFRFADNNTVLLAPINSVRVGEEITYVFVLTPPVPSLMEIRAEVTSDGQRRPAEDREETTVNPRTY